jgi:hypothetical protein
VGRVVADQVEGLRVAVGEDADLGAVGQGRGEVAQRAVDPDRQRRLGQARSDRRGGVSTAGALAQLKRGAVGELDSDLLSRRLDPAMLPAPHPSLTSSLGVLLDY